jgi:tagatose 1,6-diphosphate aldolase GatY/KbaY
MTDPAVVSSFLSATAIDALAVTIGNVHGTYAVHPPELDWARLDAVRMEAGDTPLVLHGASGLPDEMLVRAIRASVCKFNVNTEVRAAARAAVAAKAAEGRDVLEVMGGAMEAMVPVIEAKLRAFAPGR